MFQCEYCNYASIHNHNVTKHVKRMHANNLLNQTQSGFGSVVTSVGDNDPPTTINAHSNTVPIEDYNNVLGIAHGWKKECEKMQEAYRLLQENFREDGENSHAIISYLQNVLNANNIRYNLDLA